MSDHRFFVDSISSLYSTALHSESYRFMNHGPSHPSRAEGLPEPSLTPVQGWHCGHYFYRWNRAHLANLPTGQRDAACREFVEALTPREDYGTARFQTWIVSGHKADFGIVMMDPDPLKIDSIHQRLMSTPMGIALDPVYSFVSMSEVSEYLPNRNNMRSGCEKVGRIPSLPVFKRR